jgi:hypothetical protein
VPTSIASSQGSLWGLVRDCSTNHAMAALRSDPPSNSAVKSGVAYSDSSDEFGGAVGDVGGRLSRRGGVRSDRPGAGSSGLTGGAGSKGVTGGAGSMSITGEE